MAAKCKPCPFCGSADLVPSLHTVDGKMIVCVACETCDAEGPTVVVRVNNQPDAITKAHAAWNKAKR